jgi:hypothetical protein
MAQTMIKRIPLSEERWKQLGDIKQAGQTYDELLGDMVKAYKRRELAQLAKDARAGKGSWHEL